MKKIGKYIINILVILFFIIVILLKFDVSVFGYKCFVVMSGSMEPAISVDDMIFIKRKNEYDVGDIITYKQNENYVTHRIIEIDGNRIITKGDNNNVNDVPIHADNILGTYVGKISKFNFYLSIIYKPISLIIIFLIGITITIFFKEKNNESRKTLT